MLSLPIKYIGKYTLGKKSKDGPRADQKEEIANINIYIGITRIASASGVSHHSAKQRPVIQGDR